MVYNKLTEIKVYYFFFFFFFLFENIKNIKINLYFIKNEKNIKRKNKDNIYIQQKKKLL